MYNLLPCNILINDNLYSTVLHNNILMVIDGYNRNHTTGWVIIAGGTIERGVTIVGGYYSRGVNIAGGYYSGGVL